MTVVSQQLLTDESALMEYMYISKRRADTIPELYLFGL